MTAVERIERRGRFSGRAGLHRIGALCAALGNPQDKMRFVHLAGTNGKGSTAAMLDAVLRQAGYRTGLYTSPYLVRFHERIQVNGRPIAGRDLERLADQVEGAAAGLRLPAGESIGQFEFVTVLAFLYFVEQGCDIVVLETGLGGSFDATNVIAPPEAAVITPISLDHTAALGRTTGEIARSKAGILKPGSPGISAFGQPADALAALRAACPNLQVAAPAEQIRCGWEGTRFVWQQRPYAVSLIGLHQAQNAGTALQTIEALRARGWNLPEEAVRQGLATAFLPGRMQVLRKSPRILVDGGHNLGGIHALGQTLRLLPRQGKLYLVIGMMQDKDAAGCAQELAHLGDGLFVTQPSADPARALPAHELAHLLPPGKICGVYPDAADALRAGAAALAAADTLLICGSLYLAGESIEFFTG